MTIADEPTGQPASGWSGLRRQLARDYGYLMPGFPLALLGFVVLLPLTVLAVATLAVWVGLALLALALMIAAALADAHRAQARRWGLAMDTPRYRPSEPGLVGRLRVVTDPRRWLDLGHALVVALPLRTATFVIALVWPASAIGALVYPLWGWAVPGDSGPLHLLPLLGYDDPVPSLGAYLIDSAAHLVVGALLLLTWPAITRGITRADLAVTAALLTDAPTDLTGFDDGAASPGSRRSGPSRVRPGFTAAAWTWVAAAFLAVTLLAVVWALIAALYDVRAPIAMVVALLQAGAILLAVRWAPLALLVGTVGAAGAIGVTEGSHEGLPWPWPIASLLAHFAALGMLAFRHRWPWAASYWSIGAMLTVGAVFAGGGPAQVGVANAVVALSLGPFIGALAALTRLWVQNQGRVERAETVGAQESRRRMELQERTRIARELHDVVAHSMSVINVQATTARYRRPGLDEWVQREFEDIAQSSRQALGEMRALLSILRDDAAAPTAPMPGLADIGALVEASRSSGTPIVYSGGTSGIEVPAAIGLIGYRSVQEGLSNALRHAPGAAVEVVTRVEDDTRLVIEVRNAAATGGEPAAPGSGLGLDGIRERVHSSGGSVHALPTADGGFALTVSLPLH